MTGEGVRLSCVTEQALWSTGLHVLIAAILFVLILSACERPFTAAGTPAFSSKRFPDVIQNA
jgi:hypothetical protein